MFDLDGEIVHEKVVRRLLRPNNVDIAYGVHVGGERVNIAVISERYAKRLRICCAPWFSRRAVRRHVH